MQGESVYQHAGNFTVFIIQSVIGHWQGCRGTRSAARRCAMWTTGTWETLIFIGLVVVMVVLMLMLA